MDGWMGWDGGMLFVRGQRGFCMLGLPFPLLARGQGFSRLPLKLRKKIHTIAKIFAWMDAGYLQRDSESRRDGALGVCMVLTHGPVLMGMDFFYFSPHKNTSKQ
jgi:hypothetical protein